MPKPAQKPVALRWAGYAKTSARLCQSRRALTRRRTILTAVVALIVAVYPAFTLAAP